ncbi:MAG: hypothetical protein EOO75_19635 [Myxococcales bacterium]|nr:MAG: hypothetical protein EOO75_19635 [Myxococcales bacterium]
MVVEPDGPPEFRFLNGVTDVAAVQLCLVPWGPGGALGVDSAPQPPAGLAYGELLTPALPGGFDAATTSLRPYVIGGDLATVAGQGCLELAATTPAGVKAVGLPVLPPGTLTAPRSRLAVTTGCLGGLGVADPIYACGQGIDPLAGNAGLVLVDLSRTAPASDRLGVQLVHASAASGPLRVVSVTDKGTIVSLAGSLGPGQIAPRPPLQSTADSLFGINASEATLKLQDGQQGTDLLTFPLPASLADSGLGLDDLGPGHSLVVVVLGPRPGGPATGVPPVAPPRLRWLEAPAL